MDFYRVANHNKLHIFEIQFNRICLNPGAKKHSVSTQHPMLSRTVSYQNLITPLKGSVRFLTQRALSQLLPDGTLFLLTSGSPLLPAGSDTPALV